MTQQPVTASKTETRDHAKGKPAYDYIVIAGGASGAIIAGEISKTGAEVLVVGSGGEDAGPTVTNPSIWFYNVGGPFGLGAADRSKTAAEQSAIQSQVDVCETDAAAATARSP
jgi:choline dehydrogenase-like flavoprotein